MELHERDALLAALRDEVVAARRRPGRLVLVSGEAGVGKTSLLERFCRTLDGAVPVLWGACDAVLPPRPFAPLGDIAHATGGALSAALDGADRAGVFDAFLGLLRRPRRTPPIVVLEDVHWADEATLDLLRVVGRRLRELPILVVATYRADEVTPTHALRRALGDVPAGFVSELRVHPLSLAAVAAIARSTSLDPLELHRSTRGNPFFVTEVVAGGRTDVPPTVRDAVLARVARLSSRGRRAVAAASVVGQHCEVDLLHDVAGGGEGAVDDCVAGGMFELHGDVVRFRHDIARRAVYETLRPDERRRLHFGALEALAARGAEPGALARHAVEAAAAGAALSFSRAAGDRAASLGAHVEAAAHYAAALRFAHGLDDRARAELLERYARESMLVDEVGIAVRSQEEALECRRRLGDARGEADSLRALSLMLWYAGSADRAMETAELAVELVRDGPNGATRARAYATLAQRHVVAGASDAKALELACVALALAESLGEEQVAVDALTTIGVARTYLDDSGWADLQESLARALAAGLDDAAARAYINLVELARDMRRYDIAERYGDDALRFLSDRDHDLDLLRRRLLSDLADLSLDRGQWVRADELASLLLAEGSSAVPVRVKALTVRGRVRARRGARDAWAPLDEALALAEVQGEAQELCPVSFARAEAAWLDGDLERVRNEAERGLAAAAVVPTERWWLGEGTFWAWTAGARDAPPRDAAEPYVLHVRGRYAEAADAWQRIGCPYHRALALADGSSEAGLRTALAIFGELGAAPMARRVAGRLRKRGARNVPRGPRADTRANPAGLTPRQVEVLGLMRRGLRNADIAERLVVTPKTVDHHVSAILRKLDVPTRAAAAEKAQALGLQDGEPGSVT